MILQHLQARNPAQYLAALGLLDVLADTPETSGARLHWEEISGSHVPLFTGVSEEQVAAAVVADATSWSHILVFAVSRKEGEEKGEGGSSTQFPRNVYRGWMQTASPAQQRWLSAMFAEYKVLMGPSWEDKKKELAPFDPLVPPTEWIKAHPLSLIARAQSYLVSAANMVEAMLSSFKVDRQTQRAEDRLLLWLRGDGIQHTFAEKHLKNTFSMSGLRMVRAAQHGLVLAERDPILEWLAGFRSISLLPATQVAGEPALGNYRDVWRYPVWDVPLERGVARRVLDLPLKSEGADTHQTRGFVQFETKKVPITGKGDYGFLSSVLRV